MFEGDYDLKQLLWGIIVTLLIKRGLGLICQYGNIALMPDPTADVFVLTSSGKDQFEILWWIAHHLRRLLFFIRVEKPRSPEKNAKWWWPRSRSTQQQCLDDQKRSDPKSKRKHRKCLGLQWQPRIYTYYNNMIII